MIGAVKPVFEAYLACEDTEVEIRLQVCVLNEVQRACVKHGFPKGMQCPESACIPSHWGSGVSPKTDTLGPFHRATPIF